MVRDTRIKEYNFGQIDAPAGGEFDEYTSYPLNGMLKGVNIYSNNFDGGGSLFLTSSGVESVSWSMVSGTARGIGINASGLTLPLAQMSRTNATYISGTSIANEYREIPMNSVMHLVGSNVGASKSGLGIAIVYQ